MSELRVRNVDPWMIEQLKMTAKSNGITLEKQVLTMLSEHLMAGKKAMLENLRKHRARQRKKYGILPDSTPGIRAERDAM